MVKANLTHHEAIWDIWCLIQPALEVIQPTLEAYLPPSPFQPLGLCLLWPYRSISTLTFRPAKQPQF